jgi:hypothetical protein
MAPGRWLLRSFNGTAHLEQNVVTARLGASGGG